MIVLTRRRFLSHSTRAITAAAAWADGTRSRGGSSASTVEAVCSPTPAMLTSRSRSAASAGVAAISASAAACMASASFARAKSFAVTPPAE